MNGLLHLALSRLLSCGCGRLAWPVMMLVCVLAACGCRPAPPDIQGVGGYVLIYELQSTEGIDMPSMARAIQTRLDRTGSRGVTVRPLAGGRFEISIPGLDGARLETDQQLIVAQGQFEFKILAHQGVDDDLLAAADVERNADQARGKRHGVWVQFDTARVQLGSDTHQRKGKDGGLEVLVVDSGVGLDGSFLREIRASVDELGQPCIDGSFNAQGARLMHQLSSQHLPNPGTGRYRSLGIILDEQLLTAPRIVSSISARFRLTGQFTEEEVDFLVALLRAGRLPGKLKVQPVSVTRLEPASAAVLPDD